MIRTILTASALLLLGAVETGCMDINAGVPHGTFTRGSEVLTSQEVIRQRTQVQPRCKDYAYQTTPTPLHAAVGYGWNHGASGAAGGGLGYKLDALTVGANIAGKFVGGVAVADGVANAFAGGASGVEYVFNTRFNKIEGCLADDKGGLHAVPPSLAKAIEQGKKPPQSFGSDAPDYVPAHQ